MRITSDLFGAFLKCPTKCWLRSRGEAGAGNAYADWVRTQNESYRSENANRLLEGVPPNEYVTSSLATENPKVAKWRLAVNMPAETQTLESLLHAVERVPPEGRGKPAQFIPIRFVFTNKLTNDDRLLVAFDALVLSEMLGREVNLGKIIHGDDHTTLKVKPSTQAKEVRKRIEKITALLSSQSPPDLILNRHCAECEFQKQCRQKAVEKDDLSLLAGMSAKERTRHRSKGIFTVTQFSYTFRPRRTPKRAKNPAKPRYLALQALAIRENTVYIHGSPQLPESKTQVYLDIEGLPDSEFYYLIGALVVRDGQETFHSFWADKKSDEDDIFSQFTETVCQLPDFRGLHYGDYESIALKRMRARLPEYLRPKIDRILKQTSNVLSVIHPHIYFPTCSNSLKDIEQFLGCERAHGGVTGLQTIVWRGNWDKSQSADLRTKLMRYNQDDCIALKRLCEFICRAAVGDTGPVLSDSGLVKIGRTEEMQKARPHWHMFATKKYVLEDFKHVNKCAYFDYQREKVFVRTHRQLKSINRKRQKHKAAVLRPNKVINYRHNRCSSCGGRRLEQHDGRWRSCSDLKFSRSCVKRWVTRFQSFRYQCLDCQRQFSSDKRLPPLQKYGNGLMSWAVYFNVVRGLNMLRVQKTLVDLFGIHLPGNQIYRFKKYIAADYAPLYEEILQAVLKERVLHIDETTVNLHNQGGYVWVIASVDKVHYFYKPSREGDFLAKLLAPFAGVLVSDFFTAYDSLDCQQQKCLVHLLRDIDDDLLRNPLDTELRAIAQAFGILLRTIIQTVDQYGLKKHHLHKHKKAVERFLKSVTAQDFSSEHAVSYQKRFERSGAKMFTFLDYDGVPWNNCNAEHAIKRFAKYRMNTDGYFTERSLKEYLVLASVLETCEFNNVNVLKFLLSKETTLRGLFKMAGRKDLPSPVETKASPDEPASPSLTTSTPPPPVTS